MARAEGEERDGVAVPEPALGPQELVARARALIPRIRSEQDAAEERGRYSEELHREFQRAGFYRICQPRRFGGYEFSLTTFLRTMVAVSSGDPGSGWCLTLGASHALVVASFFGEEAQAEAFGPDGDFRAPHPSRRSVRPSGSRAAGGSAGGPATRPGSRTRRGRCATRLSPDQARRTGRPRRS
jgi:3-hydroxy-9,10-secoandrosta-1,3,5(10)-triene-9,17-dione monooxygenase